MNFIFYFIWNNKFIKYFWTFELVTGMVLFLTAALHLGVSFFCPVFVLLLCCCRICTHWQYKLYTFSCSVRSVLRFCCIWVQLFIVEVCWRKLWALYWSRPDSGHRAGPGQTTIFCCAVLHCCEHTDNYVKFYRFWHMGAIFLHHYTMDI